MQGAGGISAAATIPELQRVGQRGAAEADSLAVVAMVLGLPAVVLALDVVVFRCANRVSDHLDPSRMLITEKIFGFLLAALAVQLMLDGLHSLGVIPPRRPLNRRQAGSPLPGRLDLELGAVLLDLELHLEVDLIGNMRDKTDVVVLNQHIVERGGDNALDRWQDKPGKRVRLDLVDRRG